MVGKLSSLGVESIRHPKIIADIRAWLSDRLGADIARLVEEVPPVELPNQAPDPAPIEEALAEYTGGIVPEIMRLTIRDAIRSPGSRRPRSRRCSAYQGRIWLTRSPAATR